MNHHNLILTSFLLLALSLFGRAQEKQKIEVSPKDSRTATAKIEHINNQDILRIASPIDTIRIPMADSIWTMIETLMRSNIGTELILKDIQGTDVLLVRVNKNMKPGIYFRNKMRKSISLYDEEITLVKGQLTVEE